MPTSSPLGLTFFPGPASRAVAAARGLCVFPSAPGLATLPQDPRYHQAITRADVRYADSGFLVLVWFFLTGQRLCRVSGLRFLGEFLPVAAQQGQKILFVHASSTALHSHQQFIERYFYSAGSTVSHFVAPLYSPQGSLRDEQLLAQAQAFQPDTIILCLGSGIQEPLGLMLRDGLDFSPLILCTGGALDFLSGVQPSIPRWVDRLFLGWLWRILFTSPRADLKIQPWQRYLRAWGLLPLLWRYRDKPVSFD